MCAGSAQVTLVELRERCSTGCNPENDETETTQPNKTNKQPTKQRRPTHEKATCCVTYEAMEAIRAKGETGALNSAALSTSCPSAKHSPSWCHFFARVRTPCGRCAQVIVGRGGNMSEDGNSNREKKDQRKTSNQTQTAKPKPKPKGQGFPSCSTSFLCTKVRQRVKRLLSG